MSKLQYPIVVHFKLRNGDGGTVIAMPGDTVDSVMQELKRRWGDDVKSTKVASDGGV